MPEWAHTAAPRCPCIEISTPDGIHLHFPFECIVKPLQANTLYEWTLWVQGTVQKA